MGYHLKIWGSVYETRGDQPMVSNNQGFILKGLMFKGMRDRVDSWHLEDDGRWGFWRTWNDGAGPKWFDYRQEMQAASLEWPDHVFVLDVIGEESEYDIERGFYHRGRAQIFRHQDLLSLSFETFHELLKGRGYGAAIPPVD